jgi:EpsI family protein
VVGGWGGAAAPLAALPLLLVGSLLFVWGQHVGAGDVVLASLLPTSLGAFLLLSGPLLARLLLPPLLILLFAIPLPGVVSNHLIHPLQLTVAEHVAWLFDAVGVTAYREGYVIHLLDGGFEVIESCSGLRSIQVLTMLAIAWACFFEVGALHAALLVACAPLIAYGLNLVRVVGLVLYPASEAAAMHSLQGVVAFLGGCVGLYAVDSALRRFAPDVSQGDRRARSAEGRASPGGRWRTWTLAALLAGLVAASSWVPRWSAPAPQSQARLVLPEQIGDWRLAETLDMDRRFLGRVASSFSKYGYGLYERSDGQIAVFVGQDDRLHRDRSLLSAKNALPGRGWEVEARSRVELASGGPVVESLQARAGDSRLLSHHWYRGAGNVFPEAVRAWLGIDQSALRGLLGPPEALVVRLTTTIDSDPGGYERAEGRLQELGQALAASGALPEGRSE